MHKSTAVRAERYQSKGKVASESLKLAGQMQCCRQQFQAVQTAVAGCGARGRSDNSVQAERTVPEDERCIPFWTCWVSFASAREPQSNAITDPERSMTFGVYEVKHRLSTVGHGTRMQCVGVMY